MELKKKITLESEKLKSQISDNSIPNDSFSNNFEFPKDNIFISNKSQQKLDLKTKPDDFSNSINEISLESYKPAPTRAVKTVFTGEMENLHHIEISKKKTNFTWIPKCKNLNFFCSSLSNWLEFSSYNAQMSILYFMNSKDPKIKMHTITQYCETLLNNYHKFIPPNDISFIRSNGEDFFINCIISPNEKLIACGLSNKNILFYKITSLEEPSFM